MSTTVPEVGDEITFADNGATTTDIATVVATGTVNGPPVFIEGGFLIPAWCERDNGREATTVFVNSRNLLGRKGGS